MPKFILPSTTDQPREIVTGAFNEVTLYIPANEEIMETLEIDQEVTVTLKGKVVGLESTELEYSGEDFKLLVDSVEVYPKDNEFGELADD